MVYPPSCYPKELIVILIMKWKFRDYIIMINTHMHNLIILKIVKINTTSIKVIYFYGWNVLYFVNFCCLNLFLAACSICMFQIKLV